MRQRLADFARGLAALAGLAALLVGVPVALAAFVGWPLPTRAPSPDAIVEALTRRGVDDAVVVKTLAIVLWVAWLQIALAIAVEIVAVARGRVPRRVPALPGVQSLVARLVATAALLTALSSPRAADTPARVPIVHLSPAAVTATTVPVAPPPAVHDAPLPAAADGPQYVVQRHDSLWAIAERTLGDGFRWREIRDLNVGRTMPDGETVTATTETIQPGWILRLPAAAQAPVPDSSARSVDVVVQRGDSLWSIAEDTLEARLGREPTDAEVRPHWLRIVENNRDRLADPSNPSLLYAGQQIAVPAEPAAARAAPPPPPPPSADEHVEPGTEAPVPPPSAPPPTETPPPDSAPIDRGRVEGDANEQQAGRSDSDVAAPALLGVAGTALAVGTLAAVRRARLRRLARLPRGSAPPPPPEHLDDVRTALVEAADDDHLRRLAAAFRELAAQLAATGSGVRPRLVQASADRVEVLLSGAAVTPPDGWQVDAGGTVWVRDRSDVPADAGLGTPAVLVAIGQRDDTGQLYLDLEAEAIVAVTGDPDATAALVRSLLLELAHTPLVDPVHVVAVGFPEAARVEDVNSAVRLATWDDVAADLLARARQSRELLAANRWPHPLVARERAGPRDELAPVVVFLAEPPADERFEELCRLVSSGETTVTLVVAGDVERATRVELDRGELHIPSLGLTCRAQEIDAQAFDAVTELIEDGEQLPAQLPLLDDAECIATLASRVVETEQPEILVRLLGDIDVVGGRRPLTPKQTAVVAYIALHAPVAAERLEDAVWSDAASSRRKRMANTVSDCRFALGAEHLPLAVDGRYTVGPSVATDLDLFERHLACARGKPPEDAIPALRRALDLVRGPVFTYRSVDRSGYRWIDLENWMTTWELKVVDTALQLSELALSVDDTDTAIWAAERGLLAMSTHTPLTEALVKAYRARGDDETADRIWERHLVTLEELGLDVGDVTALDLRESPAGGRHDRAGA